MYQYFSVSLGGAGQFGASVSGRIPDRFKLTQSPWCDKASTVPVGGNVLCRTAASEMGGHARSGIRLPCRRVVLRSNVRPDGPYGRIRGADCGPIHYRISQLIAGNCWDVRILRFSVHGNTDFQPSRCVFDQDHSDIPNFGARFRITDGSPSCPRLFQPSGGDCGRAARYRRELGKFRPASSGGGVGGSRDRSAYACGFRGWTGRGGRLLGSRMVAGSVLSARLGGEVPFAPGRVRRGAPPWTHDGGRFGVRGAAD